MTSSPTREVDPDMLSAVLADHDERRPCPTPCRDQSERGGCLCAITAATLRALLARAEAAERERDDWKRRAEDMHRRVTAAEGCAYNRWMRDQRDAARVEAARLREALTFYANPQVYAPHPHGPAFDRRDLSWHARAALAGEGSRA